MKLTLNNKSGFALINVIIGLIIISLTIFIIINFNQYISKEEQLSKDEFSFYLQVNNMIEEIYSKNWDDIDSLETNNKSLWIDNFKSIEYDYQLHNDISTYGTQRLDLIFYNPPGTNLKKLVYTLEKQAN